MKMMKSNPTLFEDYKIRRLYDESKELWFFSVVDVIRALTQQADFQDEEKFRQKIEGNKAIRKEFLQFEKIWNESSKLGAFDKIDTRKIQPKVNSQSAAVLKSASFNLTKVADTYLDMRQWGKGLVWVNGHNLGKYWAIGPQQTIYLPAEWLKKGKNEIVVFELLKPKQRTLNSLAKPILNELKK